MANKDLSKSDPVGDAEVRMNRDFNKVIREIHRRLSTKKHSPVWTGFFASSWKAQTMAVRAVEEAENFQPWKAIKYERSLDFFAKRKAGPPFTKQLPPAKPEIQIRYPINKTFNIKKPVFIGNRAKYAAYALEGGKIQTFVQGVLPGIIRKNMTDKKGKLFLATDQSTGFGRSKDNVQYTEVNFKDPSTYSE